MPIILGLAVLFLITACLIKSGRLPVETVQKTAVAVFKIASVSAMIILLIFNIVWLTIEELGLPSKYKIVEFFYGIEPFWLIPGAIVAVINGIFAALRLHKRKRFFAINLIHLIISLIALIMNCFWIYELSRFNIIGYVENALMISKIDLNGN